MKLAAFETIQARCWDALRTAAKASSSPPSSAMTPSQSLDGLGPSRVYLQELEQAFTDIDLEELGATWDTILGIYSQMMQDHVKRTVGLQRSRVEAYLVAFESGSCIKQLAISEQFSPYQLARLLVEEWYRKYKGEELHKKGISRLMRCPERIENERLRLCVVDCIGSDPCLSPFHDRLREAAGEEYEFILERKLRSLGVAFQSEHQLRELGMAKTPDVKLDVPLGVRRRDGSTMVLHWIDSKAMFGNPNSHRQNCVQFEGYVNRFGPGLVLYWFGFVEELDVDPTVLLLQDLPSEFVVLGN